MSGGSPGSIADPRARVPSGGVSALRLQNQDGVQGIRLSSSLGPLLPQLWAFGPVSPVSVFESGQGGEFPPAWGLRAQVPGLQTDTVTSSFLFGCLSFLSRAWSLWLGLPECGHPCFAPGLSTSLLFTTDVMLAVDFHVWP